MSKLTGHKDTDFIILQQLTDSELGKVCQVNKLVSQLCQDQNFWLQRIIYIFKLTGEETQKMKNFFSFDHYRDLYIYLKEFPISKEGHTIDRDKTIQFFKNEKMINDALNDILQKDLPNWIDRHALLVELKRNLPNFLLENTGAYHDVLLKHSIINHIRRLMFSKKSKALYIYI